MPAEPPQPTTTRTALFWVGVVALAVLYEAAYGTAGFYGALFVDALDVAEYWMVVWLLAWVAAGSVILTVWTIKWTGIGAKWFRKDRYVFNVHNDTPCDPDQPPSRSLPMKRASPPHPLTSLTWGVLVGAVAVFIAACSSSADGAQSDQSQTATSVVTSTIAPEVMVECSNVERAYNAWHWEPQTSADWSLFQVKRHLDDGKSFHDAVEGYTDKPALALVLAVAQYNVELSLVQGNMTINGSSETTKAESARVAVIDAYEEFQQQTCE